MIVEALSSVDLTAAGMSSAAGSGMKVSVAMQNRVEMNLRVQRMNRAVRNRAAGQTDSACFQELAFSFFTASRMHSYQTRKPLEEAKNETHRQSPDLVCGRYVVPRDRCLWPEHFESGRTVRLPHARRFVVGRTLHCP